MVACIVLAVTFPAVLNAQPAPLLDQVKVTPLPGPASCYPGTTGTDATIFLRVDQQRIDCDVFGGGTPCLARREFPADGADGKPISLVAAIVLRPSVTGNGQSVYFSEFGFNGCGMKTAEEDNEGCFGRDLLGFDVHSIAVTPSGTLLGMTALDPNNQFLPANVITVRSAYDLAQVEYYLVQTAGQGGGALQLQSMDFTVSGRYIIIDAYNPVSELWGIFAVDRATGQTRTVVAPVPGLHLRNPALSQTSDDFITFDAQDPSTLANTILAANLLTGELSVIASTTGLGYPGYIGDDTALVFTDVDTGTESGVSLKIQALSDRLTPAPGSAPSPWLGDGGVGVIYRRGTFDGTLLNPDVCLASYGGGVVTPPPGPRVAIPILNFILDEQ